MKIFLQPFQYSERTIASTETIDTSKESSDTQLFAAGKFEGVALSRGLHAHLLQKDIEKKVNLSEQTQDRGVCPGRKGHRDMKMFLSWDKGTSGRPIPWKR